MASAMPEEHKERPHDELTWDGVEETPRRRGPLLAVMAIALALALLALFIPGLLPQHEIGWGSGFLIAPGHVVTCAHVIDGADRVSVELAGRWRRVSVVGLSRERDLALLALDPPAERSGIALAGATTLEVGDGVVAMGFPAGIALPTAAEGSVRTVGARLFTQDGYLLHGLVLVNATFRGGMSGSPLLDTEGRVVGVVGGTVSSGSDEPVGYAIGVGLLRAWLGQFGLDLGAAAPAELPDSEDAIAAVRDVIMRVEARRPP